MRRREKLPNLVQQTELATVLITLLFYLLFDVIFWTKASIFLDFIVSKTATPNRIALLSSRVLW